MCNKNLFSKFIAVILICGIFSWPLVPLTSPKTAEAAALNGKKFLPGVAKGFLSGAAACLAQVGVTWLAGKVISQKERVESVPIATGAGNSEYGAGAGKEFCIDAIATNMAKATLQKFTQSTVQWINTGFEGDPLYVRDPGSFFKGIAQEQIGTISLSIELSGAPFARSLAQSLILSQLTDFQSAMRYNIDSYLGKDRTDKYAFSFEAGGWDAWLLQTQYPQNNPIGASINVANEVSKKLAGTEKSVAEIAQDEINQGSGFLGLKECVDPTDWSRGTGFDPQVEYDPFAGMSPAEFAALTPEERYQIENDASNAYIEYVAQERADYEKEHTCKRWETRTPGKAIADQLHISLGSSTRQAELADELNESVAVIFDAMLSQFLTKGLNAVEGDSSSSYSNSGFAGYGTNNSSGGLYVTSTGSLTNPTSVYSVWSDISKLLGWQTAYITALNQQKTLITTQLLPRFYELDFCVPGPRPDWEERARDKVSEKAPTLTDYNSVAPFFLWSMYIPVGNSNEDNLKNGSGSSMFQSMFQQYSELLTEQWFSQNASINLPIINAINQTEYKKVALYKDTLVDIDQEILETNSVISRLQYITSQLQGIPNPNQGGVLTSAQQETVTQQQRILDQITLIIATDTTVKSANDGISDIQIEIDYVGDKTKGLIKQCVDETTNYTNQAKMLRFPYPETLLPLSVQNSYVPGPMIKKYAPSGILQEPTYLKNIPYSAGTGVHTYIAYGSDPNCAVVRPFIHISNYIDLTRCTPTAGFEGFMEIY